MMRRVQLHEACGELGVVPDMRSSLVRSFVAGTLPPDTTADEVARHVAFLSFIYNNTNFKSEWYGRVLPALTQLFPEHVPHAQEYIRRARLSMWASYARYAPKTLYPLRFFFKTDGPPVVVGRATEERADGGSTYTAA